MSRVRGGTTDIVGQEIVRTKSLAQVGVSVLI